MVWRMEFGSVTLIVGAINAMYSADGFVKSMMATLNSRSKPMITAISEVNVWITPSMLSLSFYNEAFDADGMIKDGYAKFASEEIALNADNNDATLEIHGSPSRS